MIVIVLDIGYSIWFACFTVFNIDGVLLICTVFDIYLLYVDFIFMLIYCIQYWVFCHQHWWGIYFKPI